MELVKKETRTFPVAYDEHIKVLEQCDTLKGHFQVLLFALEGMIRETTGDIGHLKALESVAEIARETFLELEEMIKDLRPEKA